MITLGLIGLSFSAPMFSCIAMVNTNEAIMIMIVSSSTTLPGLSSDQSHLIPYSSSQPVLKLKKYFLKCGFYQIVTV